MGLLDFVKKTIDPFDFMGDETESFLADPLDLFGERAEETRSEVSGIMERSTAAGIEETERQRQRIYELYQPYYESAVESALPQLQALAEGGQVDFEPSRLYEYSKERGERNIRRMQAAKGQLKSSATEEKISDLRLGLADEEIERLYQGQLSRIQLGAGAADAVGAASRSLGGTAAGLYSNLGAGMQSAYQSYGSARESAYQGLASSLRGLSQYMEAG